MTPLDPATFASLTLIALAAALLGLAALSWLAQRSSAPAVAPTAAPVAQPGWPVPAPAHMPSLEPILGPSGFEARMAERALAEIPSLIWFRDAQGAVTWANRAYLETARLHSTAPLSWPLPDLFAEFMPVGSDEIPDRRRASLTRASSDRDWFDLRRFAEEGGEIFVATPIDETIAAEVALRGFLQTMSRTFADLRTGLAIFDRERRLVSFNPAFLELSGTAPDWLAARPSLAALLDQMRDRGALPEPKDYAAWRADILRVGQGAEAPDFEEVWTLPDGRVLTVCARPHHDGGLAFLIDDITAEMGETRRFRSEVDLAQSVIDTLEEAIVVFAPSGAEILSNHAYRRDWRGPEAAPETVLEACRRWAAQTHPTGLWGDIREFVALRTERVEWADAVHLQNGVRLGCRVIPLAGGATLVAFGASDLPPLFGAPEAGIAAIA